MKWIEIKSNLTNPIGIWRDDEENNSIFSSKIDKMEDSQRRRFHYKIDKRSENQVYISSKEYQDIYFQARQMKKVKNESFDPNEIKSAIISQKRKDKLQQNKRNKSFENSIFIEKLIS